jgi:hypothetical protein
MARVTRPVNRIRPVVAPRPGPGRPPVDPPPPPAPTFDFTVSSLTVKNPRSLSSDTDFATLAINVLAADSTVVTQYGPVVQSLGDLGKGQSIQPNMSLTGIAVPDGGSIAVSFVVVNKGGWSWDSKVIDALELTGAAVLGALAQGQIAAPTSVTAAATASSDAVTTSTASVSLPVVIAVGAAIVGFLEGINILFADCDGTVVPGLMTIGKTELLQFAAPGAWQIIYDYPGTDSADGCGANSDYSVTYTVEPTPPPVPLVAVPDIVGKTIANGVKALNAVGLGAVGRTVRTASEPPGLIFAQTPPAGSLAPEHSKVTYDVPSPHVIPA